MSWKKTTIETKISVNEKDVDKMELLLINALKLNQISLDDIELDHDGELKSNCDIDIILKASFEYYLNHDYDAEIQNFNCLGLFLVNDIDFEIDLQELMTSRFIMELSDYLS